MLGAILLHYWWDRNNRRKLKGQRAVCRSAQRVAALQQGADAAAAELNDCLSELRWATLRQMVGRIVDNNLAAIKASLWHPQGTLVQRLCSAAKVQYQHMAAHNVHEENLRDFECVCSVWWRGLQ